jgi:type IV pilus assembly protein PilW
MKPQDGFTLIELMVSIALGLLVSAAAVQLLLTGQIMLASQQASADIQDNGVFGLDVLARGLRLSNYNNSSPEITDATPWGGLVLTASPANNGAINVVGNLEAIGIGSTAVSSGLLSHSGTDVVSTVANEWQGLSNVKDATSSNDIKSDQLVIQYQAPQDMYDCEGNLVKGPRDIASLTYTGTEVAAAVGDGVPVGGDYVVERYFLRPDTITSGAEPNTTLALACDAGHYVRHDPVKESTNSIVMSGFGGAGQIIMNRVDHLNFLLGIINSSNQLSYVTTTQYMAIAPTGTPAVRPKIVSIQLAILVRSMNNSRNKLMDSTTKTYVMLNQKVKAKGSTSDQYLRKVYTTTVSLRNGLGVKVS